MTFASLRTFQVRIASDGLKKSGGEARGACERLVDAVLQSGRCTDNVTAIIVCLKLKSSHAPDTDTEGGKAAMGANSPIVARSLSPVKKR